MSSSVAEITDAPFFEAATEAQLIEEVRRLRGALNAVGRFADDYFAPWGSWKTAWWEDEVSDDAAFSAENALKAVANKARQAASSAPVPSTTEGSGAFTPGRHLQAISTAFFNGGGWADPLTWDNYDEAGHAKWEAFAEIIGRNILKAVAAPEMFEAAQAVIARWDTPLWKDVAPTAEFINRLRAALAKALGVPVADQQVAGDISREQVKPTDALSLSEAIEQMRAVPSNLNENSQAELLADRAADDEVPSPPSEQVEGKTGSSGADSELPSVGLDAQHSAGGSEP